MSLFRTNGRSGRESIKNAQSAEPHAARRAVRYAAADNTHAALQRQFPGAGFATLAISKKTNTQDDWQTSVTPVGKQATKSNVRVQDDFAQVA